jgi:competence protein ComEC
VASGALLVVKRIAHESAAQEWLAMPLPTPNGFHLALCAVLGAAVTLARREPRWQRFWVCATAFGLGWVEHSARPGARAGDELRLTSLSVGQGDSTLIEFPDGSTMLVDAGGAPEGGADPGERVVVPVLKARRLKRVDVMVLSHPHPDHFGGLLAVLRAVPVGELWDTGQGAAHGAGPIYAALLREARARGIPVKTPADVCGAERAFGAARVRMLAPCPRYLPSRSANDNSIVLRVQLGRRRMLLTGDAEAAAEADLVRAHRAELRADVLKAGHHGSRTSTGEAFVQAVGARFAVLSCGARNRFRHPSPEVVERLRRSGAVALRTDRQGSIHFRTDGERLDVRASRPGLAPRSPPVSGVRLTPLLRRALLRLTPMQRASEHGSS